ncbi:MAG: PEP-CTERM sorting domain-containing protein [Akkermansiaceae bacterium]
MKKLHIIAQTVSLLGLSVASQAAVTLIDFGSAAGNAGSTYNLINGGGATGSGSITTVEGTYALSDTTGSSAGQVIVSSNGTGANWGDSGAGANYTGTKPSTLSSFEAAALDDGLFMNNAGAINPIVSLSFTGLEANQEYSITFYSGRGNNGGATSDIAVTLGTGTGASIANSFNNATDVGTFTATTTSSGELTLQFTTGSGGAGQVAALNFLSLNSVVPEPSSVTLLGLSSIGLILRRKRT